MEVLHNSKEKRRLKSITRSFVQVLLFWGVLLLLGAWSMGLLDARQQRMQTGAEEIGYHKRAEVFWSGTTAISGGQWQDATYAFDGQYSMALPRQAFGFELELPYVHGDERLTLSVWRFVPEGSAGEGMLVAEIPGQLWEGCKTAVEKRDDGWEKVICEIALSAAHRNRTLKMYCWNASQQTIYFDNLQVDVQR
jgi:hypothetical protein